MRRRNINKSQHYRKLRVLAAVSRFTGVPAALLPPWAQQRLAMAGISEEDLAAIVGSMRGLGDWVRCWEHAGDERAARGELGAALACYHMISRDVLAVRAPSLELTRKIADCYRAATDLHLAPLETFEFAHAGEVAMGYLQRPVALAGGTPPPVALLVPGLMSRKEDLHFHAEALLEAGYAVARIELPAHGETPGRLAPGTIEIAADAIDGLARRVDTSRMHVMSWCVGGLFALHAATVRPVRSVTGISVPLRPHDWPRVLPPISLRDVRLLAVTHDLRSLTDGFGTWSFHERAASVQAPVQLFGAASDPLVPGDDLRALGAACGGPTDVTVFEHEHHGCSGATEEICERTIGWMERWQQPAQADGEASAA